MFHPYQASQSRPSAPTLKPRRFTRVQVRPRPQRLVRVTVTWVPVQVGKLEALQALARAEYEPGRT
jgi:hypothetical protein